MCKQISCQLVRNTRVAGNRQHSNKPTPSYLSQYRLLQRTNRRSHPRRSPRRLERHLQSPIHCNRSAEHARIGIPTNASHAHTKHAKRTPRAPCVRASGLPDQSGPVLTLEGFGLSPAAASAGVAHLTPPSSESANADRSACMKTSEIVIIPEKLQAPHREAKAKAIRARGGDRPLGRSSGHGHRSGGRRRRDRGSARLRRRRPQ
jgi:hypothetical protein